MVLIYRVSKVSKERCVPESGKNGGGERSRKFGASSIKILRMDNDLYFRENKSDEIRRLSLNDKNNQNSWNFVHLFRVKLARVIGKMCFRIRRIAMI